MDPIREEQQRAEYEARCAADDRQELERYKKAVQLCVAGGFLRQEKFDEAMKFIASFGK